MSADTIEQLIILGNGFDLHCELKSSYNDFFKPRNILLNEILEEKIIRSSKMNELDKLDDVVVEWKEQGITVWDIILFFPILSKLGDKSNWCDVESAIANWVQPGQQINKIMNILLPDNSNQDNYLELRLTTYPDLDLLNKALEYNIIDNDRTVYPPCTLENLLYDIFSREAAYYLYEYMKYLKKYYSSKDSAETANRIASTTFILLEELYCLEQEFKTYLKKEVDSQYKNQAICNIFNLALMNTHTPPNNKSTEITILNFNYTELKAFSVDLSLNNREMGKIIETEVNPHGCLDEGIIFGIDGSEHLSNPNISPFTKTYRVMNTNTIILKHNENTNTIKQNKLLKDFDVIKFFGHSLAKADYSYFQSIFDFVNLYNGHTHLIFYYTQYGNKSEQEVRTETLNRVINLLTDYGNTLDNKDHGKNLIHKLLLEKRLSIVKLRHRFKVDTSA